MEKLLRMKHYCIVILALFCGHCQGQKVIGYETLKDRVVVNTDEGTLGIYPISDNAVRIKLAKDSLPALPELIFTAQATVPEFQVADSKSFLKIKTKKIQVILDKQNGCLSYADLSGEVFLKEQPGTRKLVPDSVMGEKCYRAEQGFRTQENEHLHGLGQFQDGHFNLRGITRRLTQVNSQIALPFIYSSKGYGILWHQYGLTDFNPADNLIPLKRQEHLSYGENQTVEVTTTTGTQKVSQDQSVYEGSFNAPKDGEYSVFLDLGAMGNQQLVIIDGKPCIDQTNWWLPPTVSTPVQLKAGEHQVKVVCKTSNTPKLAWKCISDTTIFRSPHASRLDYIVFYGPSADQVIAAYRNLSGNIPLFPLWAYGFWQCRERYTSGAELVEAVKGFRERELPLDVIVQDWQYWGNNGWGVPQFDTIHYANPSGFIQEIHDLNAHLAVSIWSNPDKNSELGGKYLEQDLYIKNSKWLDYFNEQTGRSYWNTLDTNLFTHGLDAWWMDATEPENDALAGLVTHIGLGDFYRLTYPLQVCQAVYEGQRAATNDKRVCILTRSAFLGQQKYASINWSGDIGGTWDAYRRQIVAGLNYTLTGSTYWTTDIGGFFRPGNAQYTDGKYHELLVRWFQWGAFNPIFRIHGYQSETEPWKYGPSVENNIRSILNLRYRLLPYIYSEAWQVTANGSSIMRPLVMDFRKDTTALNCQYEYMFGKSILVSPITDPGVNSWQVYLPGEGDWYDFWTGEHYKGGKAIRADTPLDKIPLFVKAGSILPFGPEVQHATEKSWDNLEIRVYEGADGEFTLYEDENDNYYYEKGMYSTITFSWNDAKKTLTLHEREGSFPGMFNERKFNIIWVEINKGEGMDTAEIPDKEVIYKGKKVVLKM